MPLIETDQQKNNDDTILQVIGVAVAVVVGVLVFFSFFPAFVLALIFAGLAIGFNKRHWLNYAMYGSIVVLVILLITGTWRSAFQFSFVPFNLFGLDQLLPYAE